MWYVYKQNCLGLGCGGTNLGFGLGGVQPEGTEMKSVAKSVCVVNILLLLYINL